MSHRVEAYFRDLAGVRRAVAVTTAEGTLLSFGESVELVIMQALAAHGNGRKLMFIGNGGSAAIASHMAIDYWKNGGIRATAFNDAALLTCLSNDYGYEQVFAKPIEMMSQAGDLLIAIDDAPVLGIDDLLRLLNHERVNQAVRVSLLRKGERRDRFIIPVERH